MPYPYLNPFQKFEQTDKKLEEKEKMLEAMAGSSSSAGMTDKKRITFGLLGFFVLLIVIGLLLTGIIAYCSIIVEQTWFIAGDTSKYDPIASYDEAASRAGTSAKLVKIEASLVKTDGTLDLNADYKPAPEVVFTFSREVPAPQDAPPPGAVSGSSNIWYETIKLTAYKPGQMSSVRKISGGSSSSYSYINLGMKKEVGTPAVYMPGETATPPACSFQQLWETAKQKGAPDNAVSTITYDSKGYLFELHLEKDLKLSFDQNCRLILTAD